MNSLKILDIWTLVAAATLLSGPKSVAESEEKYREGQSADSRIEKRHKRGSTSEISIRGVRSPITLTIPSNYDDSREWPAIFHYHGLNGSPNSRFLQRATGGKDYLLVGLGYLQRGLIARSPEEAAAYFRQEAESFLHVRKHLDGIVRIDPGRVYLSGTSKGGWMTSRLGEMLGDSLAGMIVLIAGRQHRSGPPRHRESIANMQIYIGVGAEDPNLYPSELAREWYERYRATVSFEIYEGLGHQLPDRAPLLEDWLDAVGPLRDPSRESTPAQLLTTWYGERAEEIRRTPDPLQKYFLARSLSLNPKFALCGRRPGAQIDDLLLRLSTRSPMKEERISEQAYRDLMWRDAQIKTIPDVERVLNGFEALHRRFPHTVYGAKAERSATRLAGMLEASRKAESERRGAIDSDAGEFRFPSEERTRPGRPGWDGNRLKFK